MPQIQTRDHGRYVIKGGFINNKAVARAFVRNAGRIKGAVIECAGSTVEAAMDQVALALDEMAEASAGRRRVDAASGIAVPTQTEFETALRCLSISGRALDLLHIHAIAPRWMTTFGDIAKFAGFTDIAEVERSYDRVAGAVATELGIHLSAGSRVHLLLALPEGQSLPFDKAIPLHTEMSGALIALLGPASPLLDQGQMVGNL